MAYQYTSLKVVIDKLLRDPLFNGITFEACVDYCVDFLRIVGINGIYVDKIITFEFEDYRALLPEDFGEINQLFINTVPARYNTDTIHDYNQVDTVGNFSGNYEESKKFPRSADYTFSIQGGVIFLSVKEGTMTLSYKAIPLDEEGYPQVPDDPLCLDAIKKYIEVEHIRLLWRHQRIADKVLEEAKQEYAWSVGRYRNRANMLTLPKAESFYNMWKTLFVKDSEYINRFRNLGTKELIRRH